MSEKFSIIAKRIYDGNSWHENAVLEIEHGRVKHVVSMEDYSKTGNEKILNTGFIAPGFVDLQVNGGGGIMLNNAPTLEGIKTICAAHAQFGTTSLLPTLITDKVEVRNLAIEAAIQATNNNIAGFAGLHLEGPHLSLARKGAHGSDLIHPMGDEDVAALIAARKKLPVLLTTVAAESVTPQQVRSLTRGGVYVSLGHSDASIVQIKPLLDAGATLFTHLFNAMSQLTGREPGMVGAALRWGHVGLIADGHHVCVDSIKIALAAKKDRVGKIFLISDAMSCTGTDVREFVLNGRKIVRDGGRLTLEDGTLAGADLDLASAVSFMHHEIGLELGNALAMATTYPARAVGLDKLGSLQPGAPADFVWLNDNVKTEATWIAGEKVFQTK